MDFSIADISALSAAIPVPVEIAFTGFDSDFTVSAVTAFPGFRGVMPVIPADCGAGWETRSPEEAFDNSGAVDSVGAVEGSGANSVAEGVVFAAAPIVGASAVALTDGKKFISKTSPHKKKTDLFVMKLPRANCNYPSIPES